MRPNYKKLLRPGNGAADITPLLGDGASFHCLISDLSLIFKDKNIDKVACVEGRGFLLGSPVATNLQAGVVPIRAKGKLKNQTYSETFIDYSGKEKTLEMHTDAIKKGERILIIDDWIETGATVKAAIRLIEKCGGQVVGIGAFMDDSSDELKEELQQYNYQYLEKVSPEDTF